MTSTCTCILERSVHSSSFQDLLQALLLMASLLLLMQVPIIMITASAQQESGEGEATPSHSGEGADHGGVERAPVQSPVTAAAGEKAKTVFSSILSPVLTLFQGKQEGALQEPTVVLEVIMCSPTAKARDAQGQAFT